MPKIIIPVHASTRVEDKSTRPYFDTGESLLERSIVLSNSLGFIPTVVHPADYLPTWVKGIAVNLQLPNGNILDHLEKAGQVLGDDLCLLQCTSPYVKRDTVERCLDLYDGKTTVYTSYPRKPCRSIGAPPVGGSSLVQSEACGLYHVPFQLQGALDYYWDGACAVFSTDTIRLRRCIFTDRCKVVITTQLEAWQVDDHNDLLGGEFK